MYLPGFYCSKLIDRKQNQSPVTLNILLLIIYIGIIIIIHAFSSLVGNYLEKISHESGSSLSDYNLVNLATAIFPLFTYLTFFIIIKYSSVLKKFVTAFQNENMFFSHMKCEQCNSLTHFAVELLQERKKTRLPFRVSVHYKDPSLLHQAVAVQLMMILLLYQFSLLSN